MKARSEGEGQATGGQADRGCPGRRAGDPPSERPWVLLNEAREFSERAIDRLYPEMELKKRPRTYRDQARKAYLAIVKQRRPSGQARLRGIKQ